MLSEFVLPVPAAGTAMARESRLWAALNTTTARAAPPDVPVPEFQKRRIAVGSSHGAAVPYDNEPTLISMHARLASACACWSTHRVLRAYVCVPMPSMRSWLYLILVCHVHVQGTGLLLCFYNSDIQTRTHHNASPSSGRRQSTNVVHHVI